MKARGKIFLSGSHEEGGSISWYVNTQFTTHHSPFVEGGIKISDCYRTIDLDFCGNINSIMKRVDKVDRLIVELNKMKESLLEADKELKPKKFYY